MNTIDTIAAICTGVGGAVSIIRISGKKATDVASKVWRGHKKLSNESARELILGNTLNCNGLPGDKAMAVYMKNPNSYTGDDVVEIHCHGGLLSTKNTLNSTLKAGARLAEPGEFTYRAFINGKMDLTQAEAVADLISAHSDMALHLAERQIAGHLRNRINTIRKHVINILAECESRMDFPEEELDWQEPKHLVQQIKTIEDEIITLLQSHKEGIVLRDGIRVVIAGKPNVGKSSLLNLLLGIDRAIVTHVPGTTRDTLEEFANIRNIPVRLTDTAGIREADDLIEEMGIERTKKTIQQAQVILWLLDASATDHESDIAEMTMHTQKCKNVIAVWNKIDVSKTGEIPQGIRPSVNISVTNNYGIEELLDIFEQTVWDSPHSEEPDVAVSSRHARLLEETIEALPGAMSNLNNEDWELVAVHLRNACSSLGNITGEEVSPDILDNIFSRFCIGK